MAVLYMAKESGNALRPNSRAAQIEFDKLPYGVALRVKAVRARNGGFHRLSWCFFTYIAKALNEGPTATLWRPDDVKAELLVATGRYRETMRAGKLTAIPFPTNFDAMDQTEYAAFIDAAMIYVRDDLCRWIEDSPDWPHIQTILKKAHLLDEEQPASAQ